MRKGVWRGLLTGLALLLAACGGGGQPQPDLTLAGISPQNPTVVQGETLTLILTFTSQNGFQGPVSLSVLEGGQPVSWLSPNSVQRNLNVPRGQQVRETLQVQVAPNAPTGSRNLTVRAAYGNQVTERALTLTVNAPPDFALSLNPTSLTVQQGDSGQTTLTLTPQNGFTGTVNLELVGAPSGVTLAPTSVNVTGSSPLTQTLTVNVGSGVAPGTYSLQVRATSGSLAKAANLSLTVTPPPDFTLSLNPTSLTVQQGDSGQTTLTLTPQNGFTGTVSLSLAAGQDPVPQGLSLSPQSVQVSGANPVNQTLTVSASSSTPTGTHRLKVRGTSGSLVKEVDLTLTVNASPAGHPGLDPPGPGGGARWERRAHRPQRYPGGDSLGSPQAPGELPAQGRGLGPLAGGGAGAGAGGPDHRHPAGPGAPGGPGRVGQGGAGPARGGGSGARPEPRAPPPALPALWRASLSEANSPLQELSAAGSLACGYWDAFDGVRRKLYCFDPATGNPTWSYDLPLAPRDVFVAGDGRVFVGGYSNLQARVLVLQGGTLLAQYDLSADFALVTALALEGDTLYVGGSRYVQAPCGSTTRRILRVRFAKYRVAGSSLTRLALHDPTPQDLQEITSPNGCTGSGDDYSPYNWSVTPALRLEGGKVYAVFSVGPVWTGSNLLDSHCLGFLRLDAATFARDWLTRPTRQGANGEASWSRECSSSWTLLGWNFTFPWSAPVPVCWYAPRSFDLDATRLFASSTGSEALLKETGGVVPVPGGDNGGALLFLPGFPEGLVRFALYGGNRLLAYPGGTEGPYALNLEVDYEVFKDPEGRVYAYGSSTDGRGLVVRLR
jgi:hypothetical protein